MRNTESIHYCVVLAFFLLEKSRVKKSSKVALIFAFLISVFVPVAVFADEIGNVVAPTRITALVVTISLAVVLALLFMKVNMTIVGLIDGVLAMLTGGIRLEEANKQMLEATPMMLGITVPIINPAVAMAVSKVGSYSVALALAKRGTRGEVEYASAFIAILLAAATYMSGTGSGNAMAVAPLAFATVGIIPELTTAMLLAAAVLSTISPAPSESSIVSKLGDISVGSYASTTRPYWPFFVTLVVVLAFWGMRHRSVGFKESTDDEFSKKSNGELSKVTLPAIFLLFAVIFGPIVNDLAGFVFFTPLIYIILTLVLTFSCIDFSVNKSVEAMVDGSIYTLAHLFQVEIFLASINVIARTGTFAVVAGTAENAPAFIVVSIAILTGILIGTPAGVHVGPVLALVLPVVVLLSFPPLTLGFVAMSVGLGSRMSFVNIIMQALPSGFQTPILDVYLLYISPSPRDS